ncbi:TIGR03943 family putative permease subunit [Actinomadura sp. 6N118]|uniref:TIGR03943 family putative permease subunit n=1 Tax=Actinomadura sp. 6N118 TaxID=3375151 RepID=UPI0037A6B8EE
MNRQAQAVLLFLVGIVVVHASATNLYLRYVKAGLRPLLLAAGAVLIVTALVTVWYEWRRAKAPQRHEHAHREPRISWLLALPVCALVLVAPPALGSYAADRTGTALQRPSGFAALPAGDPLRLSIVDYAGRAVYDRGRSLGGRRIKITGFVILDGSGGSYLTSMVLNCCAADAQPIKIGLSGQLPRILQPDTWLEVIGTYTGEQAKDPINDGVIPFINVSQSRRVPAPQDPYDS